MKQYKKYILLAITIFASTISFNKNVDAKIDPNGPYCYYSNDNLSLKIHQKDLQNAYLDNVGLQLFGSEYKQIINASGNGYCYITKNSCSFMGMAPVIIGNREYNVPKWSHKDDCPKHVIALKGKGGDTVFSDKVYIYATDDIDDKNKIIQTCKNFDAEDGNGWTPFLKGIVDSYTCIYYTAEYSNMSKEEYDKKVEIEFDAKIDVPVDLNAVGNCDILGSINDAGGITTDPQTGQLKEGQPSLAYIIHRTLQIMRIVAIVLLILLGTMDFANAVLAGNEDTMKKSQNRFVKRLIIGVVIFLIPTLIDIIMIIARPYIDTNVCTDILNNL